MPSEVKKEIELEIAYVLFIDIVGYSKVLINEQRRLLETLNQIVRDTDQFRKAEANGRLISIPTGDGMALVFYNTPEAPVECALEISRADKEHPELSLRMGVHSGPVSGVVDVNGRANIAGAGINIAQRVMDCGDGGHILLSKHVAEDLEQYGHWHRHLHDLGECEVKHGGRVSVVNLYTEDLGNPEVPATFRRARQKEATPVRRDKSSKTWIAAGVIVALLAAALFAYEFMRSRSPSHLEGGASFDTLRTDSATPSSGSLAGARPSMPEKSIAVLPFDNLSDDKQNAFFTDGVQDEILTDLAKIADLKVISRSSVMQYKSGVPRDLRKIGQELGVAHLLEGSVQRSSNKVRVNAQLIDARNDAHVWAQTYDRDLADVFAIQSEIAKAIADQLQAKLSPKEKSAIEQPPTADVTAFDLYSRAKSLMLTTSFSALGTKNVEQAISLLDQAIARDPSFFLAYCQLSLAHDQLYFLTGSDHTPARLAKAQAALDTAIRLRPDAGEAHVARAEFLYRIHLDYNGALAELEIARRTLPNDPRVFELIGYILRRQGKQEEALDYLNRALTLDPRNLFTLQQVALSYFYLRRFPENVAMLDRALAIKPDDPETMAARALVFLSWKADTKPLHQTIEDVRAKNPPALPGIADTWFLCALAERDAKAGEAALAALGDNTFGDDATQFSVDFGRGLLARMMHDENKARAAFTAARAAQEKRMQEQPDYAPAISMLGLIDAALGRKEDALREGRRAVELLPVAKEANNGPGMIQNLAIIAAWVGEKQLACDQIAAVLQLPSTLSYGRLKLLPYWDPLRGDPRFEEIVASLAPKNEGK
jgi:TolB-like protein/class 3 adenylate cyclase/Tfp pilus assembly protein PilF